MGKGGGELLPLVCQPKKTMQISNADSPMKIKNFVHEVKQKDLVLEMKLRTWKHQTLVLWDCYSLCLDTCHIGITIRLNKEDQEKGERLLHPFLRLFRTERVMKR